MFFEFHLLAIHSFNLFNRFAHSAGPSCEAVSGDVACGCGGERGGCEMEVRMEKYVGTVLPHLRGKGFA